MPIYECKCNQCGKRDEVYRPMAEYDQMPECCGVKMAKVPPRLHVVEELKPYRSMVDGSIIDSRKRHRNHLKQHGCEEVGNEMPTRKKEVIKPDLELKKELHARLSS